MTAPAATTPADAAILARLETLQLPVGDARAPEGASTSNDPAFRTYVILYPRTVSHIGETSTVTNRYSDPILRYQVTSVGVDRLAAKTASDLVCAALLGAPLVVAGRTVVAFMHDGSVPVQRDEAVTPPLFYVVDYFRLDLN